MTPVESALRELVAEIAELEPDSIELDTPFVEAGIDSLLAMEIAVHAEARFGIRLEDADVKQAQSIAQLAGLVEARTHA